MESKAYKNSRRFKISLYCTLSVVFLFFAVVCTWGCTTALSPKIKYGVISATIVFWLACLASLLAFFVYYGFYYTPLFTVHVKNYQPSTKTLQYQLSLFNNFYELAKLLKENNIPFWASAGTLLGVIRHGTIIPWDDDIDINVPVKFKNKLYHSLKNSNLKFAMVKYNIKGFEKCNVDVSEGVKIFSSKMDIDIAFMDKYTENEKVYIDYFSSSMRNQYKEALPENIFKALKENMMCMKSPDATDQREVLIPGYEDPYFTLDNEYKGWRKVAKINGDHTSWFKYIFLHNLINYKLKIDKTLVEKDEYDNIYSKAKTLYSFDELFN